MLVNIYEFRENRHTEGRTFLTGVSEITLVGKIFYTSGKLRVIYIDVTLLNPNMATKMLYYSPILRKKRLNSKIRSQYKNINIFLKLLFVVQNAKILFMYNSLHKNKQM